MLLRVEASAAQTDILYKLSPCLQASAALKSQKNYCQQVGLHYSLDLLTQQRNKSNLIHLK